MTVTDRGRGEQVLTSDLYLLQQFGAVLDHRLQDNTVRDWLIAKLLKIRPKNSSLTPLHLNRAQQEYSRRCSKRNIVLKARQLGVTTYVAARYFIQTITRPGTLTVQVAHNDDSAQAIFRMVHRFWEKLPKALQEGALVRSRANVHQIVFPKLDSEYRVETADDNAGRGMTIHNLHCSEVSRWPRNGLETLASLRAAVVPDGDIVLESTANGAAGVFYEEWQKAGETGYTQHFFPWWYESRYQEETWPPQALTQEEEELAQKHGLSEAQLAWRRMRWRDLRRMAAQEYAEDPVACFLASGECVFDLEAVEQASVRAGQAETEDNGRMMTWLPPSGGRQYVIGVDTAGGGAEGDYSCAQVIERAMGLQCAELRGHFPPFELARRVAVLGRKYEGALVAVERNNHGYGVLAHLKELNYENIFAQGGQEGWLTSAASRPAMIENLAAVLMAKPELFHSPRLLGELRTFVRHGDGNAAAADGAHDDCVMAMAVAMAVRREDAGRVARRGVMAMASLVVG
jgi:hypothetical protein